MIPDKLRFLVEQQAGDVARSNLVAAQRALSELEIPPESEFAEFYRTYRVTLFQSDVSDEQLCDISEPSTEIAKGTRFVREVWKIPEQYICLTSVQGEGAYLYDKSTGKVWDFALASRDAFLSGRERPKWDSFFDFMTWYLART